MNLIEKVKKEFNGKYFLDTDNIPYKIIAFSKGETKLKVKYWNIDYYKWDNMYMNFSEVNIDSELTETEYNEALGKIYKLTLQKLGATFQQGIL